jgi:hypothetical protein
LNSPSIMMNKRGEKAPKSSKAAAIGKMVVLYLKEPREKLWGILLETETAGVWFRGLELNSFEDYAHQEASAKGPLVAPNTLFVPYLRVEKIVVDEDAGSLPSLSTRFLRVTGLKAATHILKGHDR